jgi:hypothetical protein
LPTADLRGSDPAWLNEPVPYNQSHRYISHIHNTCEICFSGQLCQQAIASSANDERCIFLQSLCFFFLFFYYLGPRRGSNDCNYWLVLISKEMNTLND